MAKVRLQCEDEYRDSEDGECVFHGGGNESI